MRPSLLRYGSGHGDGGGDCVTLGLDLFDGSGELSLGLLQQQDGHADLLLRPGLHILGTGGSGQGHQRLAIGGGGLGEDDAVGADGTTIAAVGEDCENLLLLSTGTLIQLQGVGAVLRQQLHVLQLLGRDDVDGIANDLDLGDGGLDDVDNGGRLILGGVVGLDGDHQVAAGAGDAQLLQALVHGAGGQGSTVQGHDAGGVIHAVVLEDGTQGGIGGDVDGLGHDVVAQGDRDDISHIHAPFLQAGSFCPAKLLLM